MIKPNPNAPGLARDAEDVHHPRGKRLRGRMLRSTALLPALFTVANGLFGFACIHYSTKDPLGSPVAPATMLNLTLAAYMIVAAMACDMLDGRLARMTRKTSDFGAQLDSLSDMVSFGVAPAVLMTRLVVIALRTLTGTVPNITAERVVWCVAATYVACTALRLARFNVENSPDESAHMSFSGLPSPGAAAAIVALSLLFTANKDWLLAPALAVTASIALPALTLAAGLLMVSRVRYPHVVNQYIRGKRPFNYILIILAVVMACILLRYTAFAVLGTLYVLWGPARALWRMARPKPPITAPPTAQA